MEAAQDEITLLKQVSHRRRKRKSLLLLLSPKLSSFTPLLPVAPWSRTFQVAEGDPKGEKNVVRLLDHFKHTGPHGQHMCMVFEVLGDNLLSLIRRAHYRGLPLPAVRQIAAHVLVGLDYLHRQLSIIHTDLKPENVLLVTPLDGDNGLTREVEAAAMAAMAAEEMARAEREREAAAAAKVKSGGKKGGGGKGKAGEAGASDKGKGSGGKSGGKGELSAAPGLTEKSGAEDTESAASISSSVGGDAQEGESSSGSGASSGLTRNQKKKQKKKAKKAGAAAVAAVGGAGEEVVSLASNGLESVAEGGEAEEEGEGGRDGEGEREGERGGQRQGERVGERKDEGVEMKKAGATKERRRGEKGRTIQRVESLPVSTFQSVPSNGSLSAQGVAAASSGGATGETRKDGDGGGEGFKEGDGDDAGTPSRSEDRKEGSLKVWNSTVERVGDGNEVEESEGKVKESLGQQQVNGGNRAQEAARGGGDGDDSGDSSRIEEEERRGEGKERPSSGGSTRKKKVKWDEVDLQCKIVDLGNACWTYRQVGEVRTSTPLRCTSPHECA